VKWTKWDEVRRYVRCVWLFPCPIIESKVEGRKVKVKGKKKNKNEYGYEKEIAMNGIFAISFPE